MEGRQDVLFLRLTLGQVQTTLISSENVILLCLGNGIPIMLVDDRVQLEKLAALITHVLAVPIDLKPHEIVDVVTAA